MKKTLLMLAMLVVLLPTAGSAQTVQFQTPLPPTDTAVGFAPFSIKAETGGVCNNSPTWLFRWIGREASSSCAGHVGDCVAKLFDLDTIEAWCGVYGGSGTVAEGYSYKNCDGTAQIDPTTYFTCDGCESQA